MTKKFINKKLFLKDKMGLRMENFNILGVHQKIKFLREGGHKKTI